MVDLVPSHVPKPKNTSSDELFGGSRGKSHTSDELSGKQLKEREDEIKQIEKGLDQLRSLYELYFMGVERIEPLVAKDKVHRQLRDLRDLKIENNRLRFKLQTTQARMISYENYWGRIKRQRESGIYRRDKVHVKRHLDKQAEIDSKKALALGRSNTNELAPEATKSVQTDTSGSLDGSVLTNQNKRSNRPSARPTVKSADDLTDNKLKEIYSAYSIAKKRCGEKLDLSFKDLSANLKKQVPRLIKNSGAKHVEFKVVIKQGKAVLKAIPRR